MQLRDSSSPGAVTGGPPTVLRLEALAMFVVAVVGYRHLGGGWGLFAALFLVPDLSFLGYLAGPRIGATAYNAAHALVGPALLAAFAPGIALIWVAHIGFDRALGYGLKYGAGFGATHLGRLGRDLRQFGTEKTACQSHPTRAI